MSTNSNNLGAKTSKNEQELYICETCNYICYKKYNYDRHLLSSKHKKSTFSINQATQNEQIEQLTAYKCENCNKVYKDRTGLWRHKKTCNNVIETNVKNAVVITDSNKNIEEITALKDLMKYLMKENSEMKNLMMEQQNLMMEHQKQQSNMMLKVIETGTINNSQYN